MSVQLDTSVVVDILRAYPAALDYARGLEEVPICSEITRVEVLRGVRSGERAFTERVLGSFQWVGLDGAIARRAGEIGRSFRRSHPGIGIADLIIAATAQEFGLALATGNVKHFPMFRGLQPPYETL
ncbi:MAG: type II toxin-antitoxin system VapC family toxin [Actinomycetota bacterium]